MQRFKLLPLLLFSIIIPGIPEYTSAEGLPVTKYLEDPEHKNEIMGFYLNAVFSGINLANNRLKVKLFCMKNNEDSAFEMIDRKIIQLRAEKKLVENMTVDEIMLDLLVETYPCK